MSRISSLASRRSLTIARGTLSRLYAVTPGAKLAVEDYFDPFDEFQASETAINRRVERICENAVGLAVGDTYPRALRASAAPYLVANGLMSSISRR